MSTTGTNQGSVNGKVAIITGAGRGIGRASAELLARNGAKVVLADLDANAAEAGAQAINAAGGEAVAQALNVAENTSCEAVAQFAKDRWGSVDVLVNCAGVAPRTPVVEMSDEEWHQVVGVNLHGTFYITRAVGRIMADQGSGAIVLFASDRGIFGLSGGSHYSASKAGVIAYAKSLALELGAKNIAVNAINPGTTDTPLARGTLSEDEWQRRWSQDPLGRLSLPEDIAQTVLFLAGPASTYMTGQLVTTRMRFG